MKKYLVEIDERVNINSEEIKASIAWIGIVSCGEYFICNHICEDCNYITVKEVSE